MQRASGIPHALKGRRIHAQLGRIADFAREHDLWVFSDEVYTDINDNWFYAVMGCVLILAVIINKYVRAAAMRGPPPPCAATPAHRHAAPGPAGSWRQLHR